MASYNRVAESVFNRVKYRDGNIRRVIIPLQNKGLPCTHNPSGLFAIWQLECCLK